MKSSLRRRSSRTGCTVRRAMATLLGATLALVLVLLAVPGAISVAAAAPICYNDRGDVVPCPPDPTTVPPTTLPPPTLPPPTSPPPTSPPATSPPTVAPQTVPPTTPRTVPTTRGTTAAPVVTTSTTKAPTTTPTTAKKRAKPVAATTTSTTATKSLVASPLGRVGPPKDSSGSISTAKTLGAIAFVALLLVLGILGPELRARLGHRRPSAL